MRYRVMVPLIVPHCPLCWQGDEYVVGGWWDDPKPLRADLPDGSRAVPGSTVLTFGMPRFIGWQLRCGHRVDEVDWVLRLGYVGGRTVAERWERASAAPE